MAKFERRTADGFPRHQHGPESIEGATFAAAVENTAHPDLLGSSNAAKGTVAGYSIVSMTAETRDDAFPPADKSVGWGRYRDADRLKGRGTVVEIVTRGMDLAHRAAPPTEYTHRFYFAPVENLERTEWRQGKDGKLHASAATGADA